MVNPYRVKQAREMMRLSQEELANIIGISQSFIAQFEAGWKQPTQENTEALSKALNVPVEFFERPNPPSFPVGSLLFRAHAQIPAVDKHEAHRYAELGYELAVMLAKKFRVRPTFKLPELPSEEFTNSKVIQHIAQLTRDALGIAPGVPIPNLSRLIEQSGAIIIALPIGFENKSCDAFSQWASLDPEVETAKTKRPFIVVVGKVPGDRLRFSIAHEIGHLILHHNNLRGILKTSEAEADAFASEFLLPEKEIRELIKSPVTLTNLVPMKEKWGVSIQALIKRANTLEIISDRQRTHLQKQLTTMELRKDEPGTVKPERPRALRQLVEMVYGNPINYTRLSHDIGHHPHVLKNFFDVYAQGPQKSNQKSMEGEEEAKPEVPNNVSYLRSVK